jgi:AcrR family transcriptional regulator
MTTLAEMPLQPMTLERVAHPMGIKPEELRFPMARDWSDKAKAEQTRLRLMAAAAAEIYEKGYFAAALSDILKRAGATKGGLYHHFTDKRALALAAMEHFLRTDMEEMWIAPFRESNDPLTTLRELITFIHTSGALDAGLSNGCPLVNITQDMASHDEEFRLLINEMNTEWRDIMAAALRRGMDAGTVRRDIDADATATLFMAVRHGVISQIKLAQDTDLARVCAIAFFEYLESLRPSK